MKYLYPYGTIPAVYSPQYLWDAAAQKGLDYKVYGEPYYLYTRPYKILLEAYGADSDLVKKYYQHTLVFANEKDRGLRFTQRFHGYYKQAWTLEGAEKLMGDSQFVSILSDYYMADESLAQALAKDDKLKDSFADFLTHYSLNYAAWDLSVSDLGKVWGLEGGFQTAIGPETSCPRWNTSGYPTTTWAGRPLPRRNNISPRTTRPWVPWWKLSPKAIFGKKA